MNLLLLAILGASASPHTDPTSCAACHAPGIDQAVGPARSDTESCVACHPTADMHPTGVAPTAKTRGPASFPLQDGLVSCRTCHGQPVHEGAPKLGAHYLRPAPQGTAGGFCFSCHAAADYARSNPHLPAVQERSCVVCHAVLPEKGAAPEHAGLRRAPEDTCSTCHPPAPHVGALVHLGKAVPAAADATLHRAKADTIACWTCHDAHGQTVLVSHGPSELGAALRALSTVPAGASWPGNGDRGVALALPLQDDALCRACHGDGP